MVVLHTYHERAQCKVCGSFHTVKDGKAKGIQKWECKECGRKFLDNRANPGMRTPTVQIDQALHLYYQGTSLNDIRVQLQQKHNNYPSVSTVYKWIVKYSHLVSDTTKDFHPEVGDTWVFDETTLSISGTRLWMWDIVDTKTRFILASRVLVWQNTHEAYSLFEQATKKALKIPKLVVTDKLTDHLKEMNGPFGIDNSAAELEQFHSLFRWRNNLMGDLKRIDKAIEFAEGWLIYYNYYRPQEILGDKTPAKAANVEYLNAGSQNYSQT
jgi:putative transposase